MKWVMLTHNAAMRDLALRWKPPGLEMLCVNCTRDSERIEGVQYSDWDGLAERLPSRFMRYYLHPRPGYCLGRKMLLPLLFPGDIITDDDVFFVRDPTPLTTMGPFGEAYGFDRWTQSYTNLKRIETLAEIFETDITLWGYNNIGLSNGVIWSGSYEGWERYLHRFWEHPFTDTIEYTSNVFRVLDIMFVRCWAIKNNWWSCGTVDECRVFNQSPVVMRPTREKILKGYWVHYCCCNYKNEYVRIFNELC